MVNFRLYTAFVKCSILLMQSFCYLLFIALMPFSMSLFMVALVFDHFALVSL